jgi:hypothetical protein
VDMTRDGVDSEDVGVVERVDGDNFEQDVARVAVLGILADELFEGLLDQLMFAVVFFARGFDSLCAWCLNGWIHGGHS